MKILVTGSAGFIGFHLTLRLLKDGHEVVGLDNINDYYDVNLKYGRLRETGIAKEKITYNKIILSEKFNNYTFVKLNLEDTENIKTLFEQQRFDRVCHLAAQAGVRYSLTNPFAYIQSNLVGFGNILEFSQQNNVEHLVYASSSSIYGLNETAPFSTKHNADHPVSLYAATKKSNELMAHAYSHLYNLPTTGLRFFTVYGPWGRPDMAYFIFANKISKNEAIDVYNFGKMERDFTYIDDIVEGIVRVIHKKASGDSNWSAKTPNPSTAKSPFRVYNIGNNTPVKLMDFIEILEKEMGKTAEKKFKPIQAGDVVRTWADVDDLMEDFGYEPSTKFEVGIKKFYDWYKDFYNIEK